MADAAPHPDGAAPDRWLRKDPVDPAVRLPLLAEALVAAAAAWTEGFCALSASEGRVAFAGLRETRVAAVPERRDSLPILAALRVPAWDAMAGLVLDREAVCTVVESLFGGGGEPAGDDARPVSPVEMRIVDVIAGQAASALTAGLQGVSPARVEFDRTLPKPDPAFLGKPHAPLMAAAFTLTTLGRSVTLDLLLPHGAVEARAAAWGGTAPAAPVLDPAGWARQMRSEVSRTTLRLEAEVALPPMTLGALARLKAGQVLELPREAGSTVLLRCEDEVLFRCDLGQSAGFYTLRVNGVLERDPQRSRKTPRLEG